MFKSRSHASALGTQIEGEESEPGFYSGSAVNSNYRQSTLDDSVVDSPKYSKYMPFGTKSPIPLSSVNVSSVFQDSSLSSFSLDHDLDNIHSSPNTNFQAPNSGLRSNDVSESQVSNIDLSLNQFAKKLTTIEINVEIDDHSEAGETVYVLKLKFCDQEWETRRSYFHFSQLQKTIISNVSNRMNTIPMLTRTTNEANMCVKLKTYLTTLVKLPSILDNKKSGNALCVFLDKDSQHGECGVLNVRYELIRTQEEISCLKKKLDEQLNTVRIQSDEISALKTNEKNGETLRKSRSRNDIEPDFGIGLDDRLSDNDDENENIDKCSQSDDGNFGFFGDDSDTSSEYVMSDNDDQNDYIADGQGHLNFMNQHHISDEIIPYGGTGFNSNVVDFSPFSFAESRLADYVNVLGPIEDAVKLRNNILELMKDVLKKALGAQSFSVGGFSLRSFLPEDAICLSVFVSSTSQEVWFTKVSEVLCSIAILPPETAARYAYSNLSVPASKFAEDDGTDDIRSDAGFQGKNKLSTVRVEEILFFPEERTRKIRCVVNNIPVEIGVNRLDELCMVAFLEEVDMQVGREHLFKKSLTLLKAWLFYEGKDYKRMHGHYRDVYEQMVCALAVHLFNVHHGRIFTPFQALTIFFQTFATLNWSDQVITPYGIIPVHNWKGEPEVYKSMRAQSFFAPARTLIGRYSERYRRTRLRRDGISKDPKEPKGDDVTNRKTPEDSLPNSTPGNDFAVGEDIEESSNFTELSLNDSMNIMDPLDESNNIGTKLSNFSSSSMTRFKRLLLVGAGKLKSVLEILQQQQIQFLNMDISPVNAASIRKKTKKLCLKNIDSFFVQTLKRSMRSRKDVVAESSANINPTLSNKLKQSHNTEDGVDWESALASAATAEAEAANISSRPESSVDFQNFSSIQDQSQLAASDVIRKVSSFPANMRSNAYDSVLSLESLNEDYAGFNIKENNGDRESNIDDVYLVDLERIKSSLQYCSLLLDSEVTAPALLSLSREILKEKGALPVGEIGKMLQEATSNSQIPGILKEKFGGLKKFLELNPDTFLISVDHPYNPKVYLREGLSGNEINGIIAGNPPPALQQNVSNTATSKKRKGGKKKSKAANQNNVPVDNSRLQTESNVLSGMRGSHSMVDLSQMKQYGSSLRTRHLIAQQHLALQQQQNAHSTQNHYGAPQQPPGFMGHQSQMPVQNQMHMLQQQAMQQQQQQQQHHHQSQKNNAYHQSQYRQYE